MANFCMRCGRPLQEGEVCNCDSQDARRMQGGMMQGGMMQGGEMNNNGYPPQGYPTGYGAGPNLQGNSPQNPNWTPGSPQWNDGGNAKPNAFVASTKNLFTQLVPLFRTPNNTIKAMVSGRDSGLLGIEMIGMQAILNTIIIMILCILTNKKYHYEYGYYDSVLPTFGLTAATLIGFVALNAITAGIYCLCVQIFHGKTNYNAMLLTVGYSSLIGTITTIPLFIFLKFSVMAVVTIIALFTLLFGWLFSYQSFAFGVQIDGNKRMYAFVFSHLMSIILTVGYIYLVLKLALDSDSMDNFKEGIDLMIYYFGN